MDVVLRGRRRLEPRASLALRGRLGHPRHHEPGLLLPEWLRAPASVVSAANAIGFVLTQVWVALVALRVRAR
jgi:hypothetical protein